MTEKERAIYALDNAHTIYFEEEDAIDTNNGILNGEYLLYQKRRLLKQAITYLADDLVQYRQKYPKDSISDVKFRADFVIMTSKEFGSIKKLIERLDE